MVLVTAQVVVVVAQVQPAAMQDRLVSHRPVVPGVLELVVLFPEQQHITQEVVEAVVIMPLLPATEVQEAEEAADLAAQLKEQAVLMEVVMEHLLQVVLVVQIPVVVVVVVHLVAVVQGVAVLAAPVS
jgi:hypothetical protein